eukprot:30555-Pelagococcus_subviridis.AAC.3
MISVRRPPARSPRSSRRDAAANLIVVAANKNASTIVATRLDGGEVLLGSLRVRLHRDVAGLPPRRANLIRVLLHVLKRLQRAQRLVHGAAEREVVDGGVLHDALLVDDEEPSEGRSIRSDVGVELKGVSRS